MSITYLEKRPIHRSSLFTNRPIHTAPFSYPTTPNHYPYSPPTPPAPPQHHQLHVYIPRLTTTSNHHQPTQHHQLHHTSPLITAPHHLHPPRITDYHQPPNPFPAFSITKPNKRRHRLNRPSKRDGRKGKKGSVKGRLKREKRGTAVNPNQEGEV